MHGQVGKRKDKGPSRYGFLYFSDPISEKTSPQPGLKVAKVLERYRIPLVVLNSCESARASCGDDANIASSFIKRGVQGVLGMSFKVSKGAAIIFLESFYHDLLVNGS
jgi:CHAT domain-containing protein